MISGSSRKASAAAREKKMFCHVHLDRDKAKQKMKNKERMYQRFHTQSWGAQQMRKKYQIADNNLVTLSKTLWEC